MIEKKGGERSEAKVEKKRRTLFRGYGIEEKEEIGQRLWLRRKGGDRSENMIGKKRRRLVRG